ncbi:MAG: hypothetical protein CM15mP59_3330 [Flavobacteriaceae bacterium]|nr:MAG: hypothetical protein CM15mP59_3330 [Flavobacteriaceae bacterium]
MGRTLLFLGLVLVLVGGVILLGENLGIKTLLTFDSVAKTGHSTFHLAPLLWSVSC